MNGVRFDKCNEWGGLDKCNKWVGLDKGIGVELHSRMSPGY